MSYQAGPSYEPTLDGDFVRDFAELPPQNAPTNNYTLSQDNSQHLRYTTQKLTQTDQTVRALWVTDFSTSNQYQKYGCTVIAGNLWTHMVWDKEHCGHSTEFIHPPSGTLLDVLDVQRQPSLRKWQDIVDSAKQGLLVSHMLRDQQSRLWSFKVAN